MLEWYNVIALVVGPLLLLMVAGLPVAFSFLAVNIVGAYILLGGVPGVWQVVMNTIDSLSSFTLVPVALFMIMGEGMFQSRIAIDLMGTLDKWFGNLRGRLTWNVFSKSILGSANISVMVLLIVSGAVTFTQLLAFTGATYGMVDAIVSLDVSPNAIVLTMIGAVIFLGMFMGPLPIMLITLPIFIPVILQFGFDPIWFAAMYLVAIETGSTSPPLGGALFVMKAVAPLGTTMNEIYRAATPFIICDLAAILILFYVPQLVTWPVEYMFR